MSDESREEARAGIYEDCRLRILHAVQDRYYIPRLIVSAIMFLVSYLFFSLVLRNGIPLVDELAISIAVCALVYVRMRRSVLSKGLYVDLCGQLQNTLSTLVETEDAGLSAIRHPSTCRRWPTIWRMSRRRTCRPWMLSSRLDWSKC